MISREFKNYRSQKSFNSVVFMRRVFNKTRNQLTSKFLHAHKKGVDLRNISKVFCHHIQNCMSKQKTCFSRLHFRNFLLTIENSTIFTYLEYAAIQLSNDACNIKNIQRDMRCTNSSHQVPLKLFKAFLKMPISSQFTL